MGEACEDDSSPSSETASFEKAPGSSREDEPGCWTIRNTLSDSGMSKATTQCSSPAQYNELEDVTKIGSGTFGVVFRARVSLTQDLVAVKVVTQDKNFKNRELDMLQLISSARPHPNIVGLLHHYYSTPPDLGPKERCLNLVMQFVPCDLFSIIMQYSSRRSMMPMHLIRLFGFQILRGLAWLHNLGICHRDMKPHNVLIDPETKSAKICDFGSAKVLMKGDEHVSYISSRFYRAPELIADARSYTHQIDMWSFGCLLAEMLLGQPLFQGEDSTDQFVSIIAVLGTPSQRDMKDMNPANTSLKFSKKVSPFSLKKVVETACSHTVCDEMVDLLDAILVYSPLKRATAVEAMCHSVFDELGSAEFQSKHQPLPPLFDFSPEEIADQPIAFEKLIARTNIERRRSSSRNSGRNSSDRAVSPTTKECRST